MEWVGSLRNVTEHELRVVLIKSRDLIVAQALEVDICTQGKSLEEALKRFEHLVTNCYRDPWAFYAIKKAPHRFFDLWENGANDAACSDSKPEQVGV